MRTRSCAPVGNLTETTEIMSDLQYRVELRELIRNFQGCVAVPSVPSISAVIVTLT